MTFFWHFYFYFYLMFLCSIFWRFYAVVFVWRWSRQSSLLPCNNLQLNFLCRPYSAMTTSVINFLYLSWEVFNQIHFFIYVSRLTRIPLVYYRFFLFSNLERMYGTGYTQHKKPLQDSGFALVVLEFWNLPGKPDMIP